MPAHYNLRREKPKNVMSEYARGGRVGLKKKPKTKKGMDTPALQKAYAKEAKKKDPYQDMRNFERERSERRTMAMEDKDAPTFEKSDTKTETSALKRAYEKEAQKKDPYEDMRKFEREREKKASKKPTLRYNKKPPAKKPPAKKPAEKPAKETFYKVGSYDTENIIDHPDVRDEFDGERDSFIEGKVYDNYNYYYDEKKGEARRFKLLEQAHKNAVRIFKKAFSKAKKAKKYKTKDELAKAVAQAYRDM